VLVHTDAAQAVGKIPVDVDELGVDLLSVAGHKLYGPKGVGALYVRGGVRIAPQIRGAGHERGLRAGTENVLLAVGLGTACEVARSEVEAEVGILAALRDRLAALLTAGFPSVVVHGDSRNRLPNTLSIAVPGIDAAALLLDLGEEVAASAGAACHADGVHTSHVLEAMGIEPDLARATIRLSVGRFSSIEEIEHAARLITQRFNV
jgi:cysteine desulfurase